MQLCKYKTGQTIVEWLLQVYSEIIMITLTGKDAGAILLNLVYRLQLRSCTFCGYW